jgi:hypothetical protein
VKRLALLLAALLAAAACGSSTQQSELNTIAGALAEADAKGTRVDFTVAIVFTGGAVPKGQAELIKAKGAGVARDSRAALRFNFTDQSGKTTSQWDLLVAYADIYTRPHKTTGWRQAPVAAVTALFPGARLELMRETVLLAAKESSGGISHITEGFARKYTVTPAGDQLEQLQAMNFQGQAESTFLKTATGTIDVYLGLSGNHLLRMEVHLSGTEPQTGTLQKDDFTISFKSAKVDPIPLPSQAQTVVPTNLFATTLPSQ